MKQATKVIAVATIVFLAGCTGARSPVSNGLIFTAVSGSEAVGPGTTSSKKGESCATNLFGLFAFGDASIHKAAYDAGITKIQTVDYSSGTFLGIFAHSCTLVYGE